MCYKETIFSCPVCGEKLFNYDKNLKCKNNHLFDKSKSGYVNLLTSDRMNTKNPGDNKIMVKSRTDFLDKGYYSHLLDALCKATGEIAENGNVLFDAGCGEGYYTCGIYNSLKTDNKNIIAGGIDISKFATDKSAKRNKEIMFAVGSVFHIPVSNNSCDILLNIFSPFCSEEFLRIIKTGGYFIMVIPGKKHLWELKQIVYEKPYENNPKDEKLYGFEFVKKITTEKIINLSCNSDIINLFSMTPYFYNTKQSDKDKLLNLDYLKTIAQFEILIYKKRGL